jgi:hypothetical protein
MTTIHAAAKGRVPADGLLHPVALVALVALIVNDHWLKAAWPGPVSGRLSDVAGLILAPLLVQAIVETVLWAVHRPWGPSRTVLTAAVVLVGVGFALAKSVPLAADVYRVGLGILQWPFVAAGALISSASVPGVVPVAFVADPTDLVCLPALAFPIWLGRRRSR